MDRRTVLAAASTLGITSIAGCADKLGLSSSKPSLQEVKNQSTRIPYEQLYRNISEYEGEYVHYADLRLTDVVSGEGTKEYILTFRDSDVTDERIFYGLWDGDPFKEGDHVEIWARVNGLRTYTSLTGDRTVPELDIREIVLQN